MSTTDFIFIDFILFYLFIQLIDLECGLDFHKTMAWLIEQLLTDSLSKQSCLDIKENAKQWKRPKHTSNIATIMCRLV